MKKSKMKAKTHKFNPMHNERSMRDVSHSKGGPKNETNNKGGAGKQLGNALGAGYLTSGKGNANPTGGGPFGSLSKAKKAKGVKSVSAPKNFNPMK